MLLENENDITTSPISMIIIYLQSECIEKYQVELSSKYDREHDFDVIVGWVVLCRKHSNDVARQVETPGKATVFVV